MLRAPPIGLRFIFAATLTALGTVPLTAQRFPGPGPDPEDSLLGVYLQADPEVAGTLDGLSQPVVMTGPARLEWRIGSAEWDVAWFRVKSGRYELAAGETTGLSAGEDHFVDIKPSSVTLAPFLLVRGRSEIRAERMDEERRLRAGEEFVRYLAHPRWLGRELIGFGALRPAFEPVADRYYLTVRTEPEGAEIFLAEGLAGTSPMRLRLTRGKHRLAIRAPGHREAVYFVRLDEDAEIAAKLEPGKAGSPGPERVGYKAVVGPFYPLGPLDDQLSRVFADTLRFALEEHPRLDALASPVEWRRLGGLVHPDFPYLESLGVDLAVSGFFDASDEGLTIQANLYDVASETVQSAVTWRGSVGLDIFAALDEIAADFVGEVDRLLPQAGTAFADRGEIAHPPLGGRERIMERGKLARGRRKARPNVLSVQTGAGYFVEEYSVPGYRHRDNLSLSGALSRTNISYHRDLSDYFAIGAGTELTLGSRRTQSFSSADTAVYWALSAFAGPRLMFRGPKTEVLIGADIRVGFAPAMDFQWRIDTVPAVQSGRVGPFFHLDLPVRIGLRYYFNRRTDGTPFFVAASMGMSAAGYRFDLGGRTEGRLMGPEFFAAIGAGLRL